MMVNFTPLRMLRTRLLILLDGMYPKGLDVLTLRSLDGERNGLKMLRREIAYLTEKGLARSSRKAGSHRLVVITSRGRDFLSGDVTEVGLEPSESFGYSGPEGIS